MDDDDDEISNYVDLHMYMLGGGWKGQDLQGLLCVMPASDIPVPAYSSGESVESSISLVILSDTETEMTIVPTDIPIVIPEIALEVEAVAVASPASALDLTVHLISESNPSKDPPSSYHQLVTPGIYLFLSDDHSEFDPLEDPSEEDTPKINEATIARWRAAVALRSSSSSSSTSTPPAPLQKRVHLFPARILANHRRSRYVSSSSSPLPRKRRRVSPYSSSSSPVSVGLSRKRCKFLTTSLPAADHLPAALPPIRVDHLPPRKRLRDSSSSFHQEVSVEVSIEDSTKIGYEASIKDGTEIGYEASIEDGTETGYEASIEATIKVTTEVAAEPHVPLILREQTIAERLDKHEEVIQEMYDHILEMPLQRTKEIEEELKALNDRAETAKIERQLGFVSEELRQSRMSYHADRERMTPEAIEELLAQYVAEALAAHKANRNIRNIIKIGDENEDENEGDNRNGNGGGNSNVHGDAACEYTYKEFLNCQPLNFKGTEGAVGLARWFEKMEYVFHISNYTPKCQVKYATCTLQNGALTWWNSYKRPVDTDVAYVMPWKELMKLMTEVYCPRNEIQKMESGLWNLTMKGNDVTAYKQRF
ncbi:reverse transcriptase domain-containing protein [Tanacetum coccineum]